MIQSRKFRGACCSWLAVFGLIFLPHLNALAQAKVDGQLQAAAVTVNSWKTMDGAVAALKKAKKTGAANAFTKLRKKLGIDGKARFPAVTAVNDTLYLDGYPKPIRVLSLNPLRLQSGHATHEFNFRNLEKLDSTYYDFKNFLGLARTTQLDRMMNWIIPDAKAGQIEIFIGGLLTLYIVGTVMGSGGSSGGDMSDAAAAGYNRSMDRLISENKAAIKGIFCGPESSLKPKAEFEKNKPVVETQYIGSKTSRDLGIEEIGPDHLAITLVKKYGANDKETQEFTFLKNKDDTWNVTAATRSGEPSFVYAKRTPKKDDKWYQYYGDHTWLMVEPTTKDGKPVTKDGDFVDTELALWKDTAGKALELPVKKVDAAAMRTIFHRSSEIGRICSGKWRPDDRDDDEKFEDAAQPKDAS